jgi:putative FmdB family regulatory protein
VPIYEYECLKCGEVFEVQQRMSDPPKRSHACGSRKVKRLMSNTSFVLKGTGWYKTDYADPKKKPQGDTDKSEKKDTDKKDTDKKDTDKKDTDKKDTDKKDTDKKADKKADKKGDDKAAKAAKGA